MSSMGVYWKENLNRVVISTLSTVHWVILGKSPFSGLGSYFA